MTVRSGRLARCCLLAAGFAALTAGQVCAQWLPSRPIALADGRVTIGGDVSASFGSSDPGFFDYTDYEHSALRMLRVNVSAAVKAGDHLAILGDLLTENIDSIRPYALYLRVRPWTRRPVDIQIGRLPPTFGAFARRSYVSDNPLIGYPLAYQYLTTLRPDALPANADELIQKRGGGWLVRYSTGSTTLEHGVPLVSAFRWDTGVQVHAGFLENSALRVTASVTNGTISDPRVSDNNGGKQVAGRLEWRPNAALAIGASGARGAFVSDAAIRATAGDMQPQMEQSSWGADVEFSRDYYIIRAEAIATAWQLPACSLCPPAARTPAIDSPLRAQAISVEGRYKISPSFYTAARFDHLGFSTIAGTLVSVPWDAPVTRFETGGGYSIQRNLLAKVTYQRNTRDGGRLKATANQVAAQVVYWF